MPLFDNFREKSISQNVKKNQSYFGIEMFFNNKLHLDFYKNNFLIKLLHYFAVTGALFTCESVYALFSLWDVCLVKLIEIYKNL